MGSKENLELDEDLDLDTDLDLDEDTDDNLDLDEEGSGGTVLQSTSKRVRMIFSVTVSYTHLTLPTILLV